jgi:hypothetical protein
MHFSRMLVLVLLLFPVVSTAQSITTPRQVETGALLGLNSLAVEVKSGISQKGYEAETIREAFLFSYWVKANKER